MAYKNHYKKILVIGAALFLLFAPAGMATKINIAHAQETTGGGSGFTIPTVPLQTLSLPGTSIPAATTPAAGSTGSRSNTGSRIHRQAPEQPLNKPRASMIHLNPATCSVFYVSLIVNGDMGVVVSIGAWLVKLGLQFNDNIFNSPECKLDFLFRSQSQILGLCSVLSLSRSPPSFGIKLME